MLVLCDMDLRVQHSSHGFQRLLVLMVIATMQRTITGAAIVSAGTISLTYYCVC